MFRTDTDHTVTLQLANPETGALEPVDVVVKKGQHKKGKSPELDAALEQLWSARLATDDDRPVVEEVTDIAAAAEAIRDNEPIPAPITPDPEV